MSLLRASVLRSSRRPGPGAVTIVSPLQAFVHARSVVALAAVISIRLLVAAKRNVVGPMLPALFELISKGVPVISVGVLVILGLMIVVLPGT